MLWVEILSDVLLYLSVLIFFLIDRKRGGDWRKFLIVFVLITLFAYGFKYGTGIERPDVPFGPTSPSFPSNHAALAFGMGTYVFSTQNWWVYLFSISVGLTRWLSGVHYLVDIIGGLILGSFIGYWARVNLNEVM